MSLWFWDPLILAERRMGFPLATMPGRSEQHRTVPGLGRTHAQREFAPEPTEEIRNPRGDGVGCVLRSPTPYPARAAPKV
ncbi:hypothetical protein G7Z17_g11498 [Cylindrodendrum hubeiense]|uniref:Uncharacterized protein n=1 Tax=Cylindrodendrum hubeiense TaxID=595255 RepID=A0A9P5H4Z8_9HYPO|nr:hypothetical protein G7Z17_g11498 [Cylindrodendrum hubeiense]